MGFVIESNTFSLFYLVREVVVAHEPTSRKHISVSRNNREREREAFLDIHVSMNEMRYLSTLCVLMFMLRFNGHSWNFTLPHNIQAPFLKVPVMPPSPLLSIGIIHMGLSIVVAHSLLKAIHIDLTT